MFEFATKWNISIEQPSCKHSPLSPPPKDPMIPPRALPNFCSSFPSNIFQMHTVQFDDIMPSIIPLLYMSAASTNK
jgi:hypothetical protein